jgi:hypothetical protein
VTDRQFLWGLSNGVGVFAIAGAFWLGLGIAFAATQIGSLACTLGSAVQVGIGGALFWAAVRLRRKSGFRRSELRQVRERSPETRRIITVLRWTTAGQTALIGFAVWVCIRSGAEQQIWSAIALVVSLHLIPLARVFHVRAYYATGVAGGIVSTVTIAGLTRPHVITPLAIGMATVMWLSAVYLLWNADRIAKRAIKEPWAV